MITMSSNEYEDWVSRSDEEILNELTASYIDAEEPISGIRAVVLLGYFDSRYHNDGCFGFFDHDFIYPRSKTAEKTKSAASTVGCEFLLPMLDLGVELRSVADDQRDTNAEWDAMDDEYERRRHELVEAVGRFMRNNRHLFVAE